MHAKAVQLQWFNPKLQDDYTLHVWLCWWMVRARRSSWVTSPPIALSLYLSHAWSFIIFHLALPWAYNHPPHIEWNQLEGVCLHFDKYNVWATRGIQSWVGSLLTINNYYIQESQSDCPGSMHSYTAATLHSTIPYPAMIKSASLD